jgi:tetratricopeptide (TPR) repeat protein
MTAQLIAGGSGRTLWADRLEVSISELFRVQSDIASRIAATIDSRVASIEAEKTRLKPLVNWTAYDHFLKGRDLTFAYRDVEALPYLEKAVELDPDNPEALACRAFALVGMCYSNLEREYLERARLDVEAALRLDSFDSHVQHAAAYVKMWCRQFEDAAAHFARARALNPGDRLVIYDNANFLNYMRKSAEALDMIDQVLSVDPYPPGFASYVRGVALFQLGRYRDAITEFNQSAFKSHWHHAWKAAALEQLGLSDKARSECSRFLAARPTVTIRQLREFMVFRTPETSQVFLDALRRSGLPD